MNRILLHTDVADNYNRLISRTAPIAYLQIDNSSNQDIATNLQSYIFTASNVHPETTGRE